jgi:oxygen-dependent protoporphyrinogen oxidase
VSGRVVVVGGGIAGLAAAHRLLADLPPERITLIESASEFGGKTRTEQMEGFAIERGADSFLASKPEARELAEALGIGDHLRQTQPHDPRSSRAFVVRRGRMHPIPEGLSGLVPSRLGPVFSSSLLSLSGKVRVAMEPFIPARRDDGDESVADFISRRLGREAYDWLVQPLIGGVYGGDGNVLSAETIMPELRRRERAHGSILRAIAGTGVASPAKTAGFLTFENGMQELVDALVGAIRGVDARLSTSVASITRDDGEYRVSLTDGTAITATAVILATPANVAARQCAPFDSTLSALLARIPFGSCATVSLAFRADAFGAGVRGHGYLRPRAEPGHAIAVTWVSRKWNHRAPSGNALTRVFFDGPQAEHDDDAGLISAARAELATAGVTAEPLFARVQRWPRAMPQYAPGHRSLVAQIVSEAAKHPGFALAGNSYEGVGIPDAIRSARAAAIAVLQAIHATRETVS